jgi:hypothetical protein
MFRLVKQVDEEIERTHRDTRAVVMQTEESAREVSVIQSQIPVHGELVTLQKLMDVLQDAENVEKEIAEITKELESLGELDCDLNVAESQLHEKKKILRKLEDQVYGS